MLSSQYVSPPGQGEISESLIKSMGLVPLKNHWLGNTCTVSIMNAPLFNTFLCCKTNAWTKMSVRILRHLILIPCWVFVVLLSVQEECFFPTVMPWRDREREWRASLIYIIHICFNNGLIKKPGQIYLINFLVYFQIKIQLLHTPVQWWTKTYSVYLLPSSTPQSFRGKHLLYLTWWDMSVTFQQNIFHEKENWISGQTSVAQLLWHVSNSFGLLSCFWCVQSLAASP